MAQQGFEILLDTTGVRLNAVGKTLKDLFGNALKGMAEFMKPNILAVARKARKEKQSIRVEAVDINSLLVEFLSKAVAMSDINSIIFTNLTVKEIGDNFLEGELSGIPGQEAEKEVRAVSYADVDIKRNPQGMYETTLVLE